MNEKEILVEILENTKTVKKVVVDKVEKIEKAKLEKAEKAKSAKSKAESKFKMVGTKLNETELADFQAKLEELDKNPSQYFKDMIKFDYVANEELLRRQENSIEDYKLKYENERSKVNSLNSDINDFKIAISDLKVKLDQEQGKSFLERLKALF